MAKEDHIAPLIYFSRFFSALIIFGLAFFLLTGIANAAVFQISPKSGIFASGVRFTTEVSLDTQGKAINSAEGVLSFNSRYLNVEQILTTDSIFKFWVQEPNFSNAAGTISFGGGLATPGYNGSNGRVFKIIFSTRGAGQPFLKLTSGAILANDGVGTNVLNESEQGIYTITADVTPASIQPIDLTFLSSVKPNINSSTHPDESRWYSQKEFRANWSLLDSVIGVNYALSGKSSYNLTAQSKGLKSEAYYDLSDFKDGEWYFFARLETQDGWGPIVKRSVNTDRLPPESFTINISSSSDPTEPQPALSFNAIDAVSGIDFYQVKINDGEEMRASSGEYKLPLQKSGEKKVAVRAYDKAGNYTDAFITVNVEPISKPVIVSYSDRINTFKQAFVAEGTGLPNVKILGRLEKSDMTLNFETNTDVSGAWQVKYTDWFPAGDYNVFFWARDSRGALSLETEPLKIEISGRLRSVLGFLGEYTILAVGAIIAFVIIFAVIYFAFSRFLMLRRRILKELAHFQGKIYEDIGRIKEDVSGTNNTMTAVDVQQLEKDVAAEMEHLETTAGQKDKNEPKK